MYYLNGGVGQDTRYHVDASEEDGLGKFRFRPGRALKRVTKITKTSFQPKKIFGAIGSVVASTFTLGLGPIIAPKVFSANSKTMKSFGMAVAAIVVVAGAVVMAPAIAAALGPTLSSGAALAGKAVTGMQTFMTAWNKLSPAKAQQMSTELTPQQVADVETGKAQLTEGGLTYGQPPGSLMVQGQPVPTTDFGPSQPQGGRVSEAGLIVGLSPMTIGLMIGIPLVMQLLLKKK